MTEIHVLITTTDEPTGFVNRWRARATSEGWPSPGEGIGVGPAEAARAAVVELVIQNAARLAEIEPAPADPEE